MSNTTSLAMKATLANYIRKTLYKKRIEQIPDSEKLQIFEEIFSRNLAMHWELNRYKDKRKDRAALLKQRLAAPQTKSIKKKLGLIKKNPNPDFGKFERLGK